jgi:hypothetical protein
MMPLSLLCEVWWGSEVKCEVAVLVAVNQVVNQQKSFQSTPSLLAFVVVAVVLVKHFAL